MSRRGDVSIEVSDRQRIVSGSQRTSQFEEVDEKDQRKWRKIILLFAVIFVIAVIIVAAVSATTHIDSLPVKRSIHFPVSPEKLNSYPRAAAAADAGACSQIARDIMQNQGGSAVDGALAATICTGAFNMYAAGIGGGFMMTIWNQAEQRGYTLNARETAPMGASQDMFQTASSTTGSLSIAIPGEIAGYWAAHQRFGRAPWASLFQPTIKICRETGVRISSNQANAVRLVFDRIKDQPDAAQFANLMQFLYNKDTGALYAAGQTIFCPKLADTLERIANSSGPDFYSGALAQDVLADLRDAGAIINETDLANYQPVFSDQPLNISIKGGRYQLISTRPPGSGAILGLILNIMAGYNLDFDASQDTLTYHRFVESLKFAYGQRMLLGDEAFNPSMPTLVDNLTSLAWADDFRSRISDAKTQPTAAYLPNMLAEATNHGTSHISVIDADGNAVAITSTINNEFGSGVMGTRTGIIFNDQMDDFSKPNQTNHYNLPPSPTNYIEPGKRPQSSTCPAVFLEPVTGQEGTFRAALVVGGSGGSRITSGVAYVAMRILWFGEDTKMAVDALRVHHQLIPEVLRYESGMPNKILNDLVEKGHINQTAYDGNTISAIQAIQIAENGVKWPFSDARKELAFPDGY